MYKAYYSGDSFRESNKSFKSMNDALSFLVDKIVSKQSSRPYLTVTGTMKHISIYNNYPSPNEYVLLGEVVEI